MHSAISWSKVGAWGMEVVGNHRDRYREGYF
jgi:hypothetical protein